MGKRQTHHPRSHSFAALFFTPVTLLTVVLIFGLQVWLLVPLSTSHSPSSIQQYSSVSWGRKVEKVKNGNLQGASLVNDNSPVAPAIYRADPIPMWSPIIEDSLLAYSAHWDVREVKFRNTTKTIKPPYVRLLASSIMKSKRAAFKNASLACQFYFENGTKTTQDRPAKILTMSAKDKMGTRSYFILCPAEGLVLLEPSGTKGGGEIVSAPASVSIACQKCTNHWAFHIHGVEVLRHFLTTKNNNGREKSKTSKGKLAVCIRPAYGPWAGPIHLVQFLLYYMIAGAERFTFYGTNALTPHMEKVIRVAQSLGVPIEVLPWNFQYSYEEHRVMEYHQYMGIQACLYRQMPYYENVAVIDIDEFISPRGEAPMKTTGRPTVTARFLVNYLDTLDARHPNASGYMFRNNFFFPYEERGVDQSEHSKQLGLPFFDIFHTTMRYGPFNAGMRSKMIVKADRTFTTTTHSWERMVNGTKAVIIKPTEAGVYHFRRGNHVDFKGKPETDLEMLKYYDLIRDHPFLEPLLEAVGTHDERLV